MRSGLVTAANKLLNSYGNDIVLVKTITTGKVYDPVSDTYVGATTTITVNTKTIYKKYSQGMVNIENDKNISKIAIVAYQDDLDTLDTSWTIDGNKIYVVEKTQVENGVIIFKLYV